ncbi:hypothetical protein GGQ86_002970 [Xanthobacter flavus]|uniref:Bacteriophage tail tape measure N-terminal domain-containing protein n=1 Tax=Xanthobacter flavus TaxID=281 RepID=A0A9W6FMJ4_XANFL|nr:phage tail length tape measure family protein [Xanthobacter flavus]MDR6334488.1 hypothetical protein [Xanthobacter flavus]GLI23492.1 hypothetical protein XFLAVUS301_31660 [Xanthobacter flavus]
MADVARLGLSVDSSEVRKGATALDELSNASNKAEKAGGGLKNAFARLERLLMAIETAVRDVEGAIGRMSAGLAAASAKMDGMGAASAAAAAKTETMAISASSVSVSFGKIETAAQSASAAVQRTGNAMGKAANSNAALSAAVGSVEAALMDLAQVSGQAERAIEGQATAATKAANANTRLTNAVNDNSAAAKVGSHHAANLAAQFQDVAVSAAGGQNPIQVALQQGTQMAMVFSNMAAEGGKSASTLALLGSAFAVVFSPVALIIISITALVAGIIQLVNWIKVAQAALYGFAKILPTIAPYAAAAAAGLALIYAPQIISGIVAVVAAIARLVVVLGTMAVAAAAANPFGALVLGIAVALTALNAFQKDITRIFGVDIVGAAKKGVNYIIGSFVAAFNDIKFLWTNFPSIMGGAAIGAANAVLKAMETMINAGGALLNSFIAKVNEALSNLPGGIQIGEMGKVSFGQIANPYAAANEAAGNARGAQQQKELNTDYLGKIGGAISKGASAASAKLKEWAAGLAEVDDKAKKAYADIIAGADRHIASLKAEIAAVGMSEQAAATLKAQQDLLNQANEKDISLSAQQKAQIAAKAAEIGKLEVAAKKAKEAFSFVSDTLKGFLDDLRTGLQQGQTFWQAFGNAAMNVLNKIISKIEDQLINALMSALNAGGFNWGGLFSSGASSGSFGSGGIGHAATGGRVVGPGSGTSDRAGLFALSNGEFVVRAAMAKRYGGLLEAINSGRMAVPGLAAGGSVGGGSGGALALGVPEVQIVNQTGVEATGKAEMARGQNGQPVLRLVLNAVKKDYANGGFDKVTKSRNGVGPAPTRRG